MVPQNLQGTPVQPEQFQRQQAMMALSKFGATHAFILVLRVVLDNNMWDDNECNVVFVDILYYRWCRKDMEEDLSSTCFSCQEVLLHGGTLWPRQGD